MTRKASQSYSHVCMDAMQDKQQCIQDEWAVNGISGEIGMMRVQVGIISAKSAPT